MVEKWETCQLKDPVPNRYEPGNVHVEKIWCWLAIDVTHYQQRQNLSIAECRPGLVAA